MYSQKDLIAELEQIVADKPHEEISQSWLAAEVMARHPYPIENQDHKEFYALCGYGYVKQSIHSLIKRFEPPSDGSENGQMTLGGEFDLVQTHYAVIREGEPRIVPVDLMTDDEIKEKENRYLRAAKTLRRHAEQLKAYRLRRVSIMHETTGDHTE